LTGIRRRENGQTAVSELFMFFVMTTGGRGTRVDRHGRDNRDVRGGHDGREDRKDREDRDCQYDHDVCDDRDDQVLRYL
jgi:hypothetical protein